MSYLFPSKLYSIWLCVCLWQERQNPPTHTHCIVIVLLNITSTFWTAVSRSFIYLDICVNVSNTHTQNDSSMKFSFTFVCYLIEQAMFFSISLLSYLFTTDSPPGFPLPCFQWGSETKAVYSLTLKRTRCIKKMKCSCKILTIQFIAKWLCWVWSSIAWGWLAPISV